MTSRRLYLVAAAIVAVMTVSYSAWRYANGVVLSDEVIRAYEIVMAILIVSWLVKDPQIPATQKPSFDHGAFIWATFPLLAAYHMYSAHRWRGIAIVIGLLALLTAPTLLLTIMYVAA